MGYGSPPLPRLLGVKHASADVHTHLPLGAEPFRKSHHVVGHRVLDGGQLRQTIAEDPAAADILLWWIRLLQLQARRTTQLTGILLVTDP